MAGAVVLGIFAMVYVQSVQNRANFSQITNLMSFREQVITYYSSVVANRATWECTVRANGLAGVLTSEMSHTRLEERKGRNAPDGYLSIRDYSGDCLTTSGGVLLIAQYDKGPPVSGGLGLNLQDYNDLPIAQRDCDNSEGGTHFCLRVEWKDLRPDWGTSVVHGVEVKLVLTANRKAIKKDLDVNFELKDKEHHLFMRRTVSQDCGNHAIVGVNAREGAVGCFEDGVLVVPIKGSCPRTSGGGTTAIAHFDYPTGLTKCSATNILVEKVNESDTAKHCGNDNKFGVVRIYRSGSRVGTFQCSTNRWGTNRGGVEPGACSGGKAIKGFRSDGRRRCVRGDGGGSNNKMLGLRGAQGERGMSGRDRYNQHSSTGRVYMGQNSRGNIIYRQHPSGPAPSWWPSGTPLSWRSGGGVGPRGPRGQNVSCDRTRRGENACHFSYTPCT